MSLDGKWIYENETKEFNERDTSDEESLKILEGSEYKVNPEIKKMLDEIVTFEEDEYYIPHHYESTEYKEEEEKDVDKLLEKLMASINENSSDNTPKKALGKLPTLEEDESTEYKEEEEKDFDKMLEELRALINENSSDNTPKK